MIRGDRRSRRRDRQWRLGAFFGVLALACVAVAAVWAATGAENSVIAGTNKADTLMGSRGNDRMLGRDGNDWLRGMEGNDTLDGGDGRDTLSGGPGKDVIRARDGARDRVYCGRGADRVVGDMLDRIERDCETRQLPQPPPPPPPPPAGSLNCSTTDYTKWRWEQCRAGTTLTLTNESWHCEQPLESYGPLPIKIVSIATGAWSASGAVTLNSGCAGSPGTDVNLIVDIRGDGPRSSSGSGSDAFKTRVDPHDIRVTGSIQCGRRESDAHQDAIQIQGGANITFVNVEAGGDYDSGTSTCQSAGGTPYYSRNRITNVDLLGGKYIGCNKALNGSNASGGSDVIGARFRSGRTNGSDPNCADFSSSPPCINTSSLTLRNVTCEQWLGNRWTAVPPK